MPLEWPRIGRCADNVRTAVNVLETLRATALIIRLHQKKEYTERETR